MQYLIIYLCLGVITIIAIASVLFKTETRIDKYNLLTWIVTVILWPIVATAILIKLYGELKKETKNV